MPLRSALDIAEKAVEDARQALYGSSADTSAKDAEGEQTEFLRGEQLRLMNYINTHGHTAAEHRAAMQQLIKVMEELGLEAMRQNLSQTGGREEGSESKAQRPRTDLEILQQRIIDEVGYKEASKQEDSQSEGQSMDE